MENIIVEIFIAPIGETADFMLPAHVEVRKILTDLTRLVEQFYQQITYDGEQPLLFSRDNEQVIHLNMTLAQAGIKDGHRLILV